MTIAITITAAAVVLMIVNSQSANRMELGLVAYDVAESGAENAVLRLLRDPAYAGETLTIGSGAATITVSGSDPYTILSKGTSGNFLRQVQVVVTYNGGIMSIASWKDLF